MKWFCSLCKSLLDCLKFGPMRNNEEAATPQSLNIVVGFFFLINYELGTGFLGIPFAFFHAGLLTGAITLIVATFLCWNTAIWVLEVMARAQALVTYRDNPDEMPRFEILITRKFEFSELCSLFLGRWSKYAFLLFISAFTFLACLAYATVAGTAWSVNLPLDFGDVHQCNDTDFHFTVLPTDLQCRNAYWFCLFLFGCIVVPLSLVQLREQLVVQMIWSLLRFAAIGTILLFSLINLITVQNICECDNPWGYSANTTEEDLSFEEVCSMNTTTFADITTTFNPRAWFVSVPVIATALNFHQGIPALTHPVKNKKRLGALMHTLMFVISMAYMLLGVVLSLWWKRCIDEVCTLNWDPLTDPRFDLPLRMVSYFIMIFPSVDVISIYPLIVLTMVNNLYIVVFGKDSAEASKTWKTFFFLLVMKFTAALLPIIVALAVSNLVTVLKFTGLAGIFLAFFFPTLLEISSEWVCRKKFAHFLKQSNGTTSVHELQETTSSQGRDTPDHEDNPLIPYHKIDSSSLYMTPYSSFFSHWPVVMVLGIVQLAVFILALLGVFLPISVFSHDIAS